MREIKLCGSGKKLIERPLRRFMFRLALQLGMTVTQLEARMSYKEVIEWMAFANMARLEEQRPKHQVGWAARCDYCHRAVRDGDICRCGFAWFYSPLSEKLTGVREHNYRNEEE